MLKWFKLFSSTLTRQLTDYLTLYKKAQTTFLCMNVAVQTLTCVCVSQVVSPFTAGSLSGNCQWLCCFESNLLLISIQTVLNKFSKLILKCNHFNFSLVESTQNWLKMFWKSKVKIDWKNWYYCWNEFVQPMGITVSLYVPSGVTNVVKSRERTSKRRWSKATKRSRVA